MSPHPHRLLHRPLLHPRTGTLLPHRQAHHRGAEPRVPPSRPPPHQALGPLHHRQRHLRNGRSGLRDGRCCRPTLWSRSSCAFLLLMSSRPAAGTPLRSPAPTEALAAPSRTVRRVVLVPGRDPPSSSRAVALMESSSTPDSTVANTPGARWPTTSTRGRMPIELSARCGTWPEHDPGSRRRDLRGRVQATSTPSEHGCGLHEHLIWHACSCLVSLENHRLAIRRCSGWCRGRRPALMCKGVPTSARWALFLFERVSKPEF